MQMQRCTCMLSFATQFESDDPENRIAQLEREMKLLSWHKLANEAALKAAIIRTKKLKRHDKFSLQQQQRKERSAWMEQIIREEQMKPLEVNTHFIKEYEQHEHKQDERLEMALEHHIGSLQHLQKKMVERQELQQRKERYKTKRAALHASSSVAPVKSKVPETRTNAPPGKNSAVLGSLGKLVELERRINNLETSMQKQKKKESRKASNLSQLGMLRFRKKKIEASLKQPAKTMFAVTLQAAATKMKGDSEMDMNEWLRAKQDKIRARNLRKSVPSNTAGKQISGTASRPNRSPSVRQRPKNVW